MFEFEGDKLFEKDYEIYCKKSVIEFGEFNKCKAELTMEDSLKQMNDLYKQFFVTQGEADAYKPFELVNNDTLTEYCNKVFSKVEDTHNRLVCVEIIG